jgi:hypothetical protein
LGDYSSQVGQHPVMRVERRACGISEARRVCQDESDTINSGALRRLTVRGWFAAQNMTKMLFIEE